MKFSELKTVINRHTGRHERLDRILREPVTVLEKENA